MRPISGNDFIFKGLPRLRVALVSSGLRRKDDGESVARFRWAIIRLPSPPVSEDISPGSLWVRLVAGASSPDTETSCSKSPKTLQNIFHLNRTSGPFFFPLEKEEEGIKRERCRLRRKD
ncbi:hypothetical protein AVEN_187870-1 [Araneus ventricosus]|uniref:Uncharacterized protein n=1 Tax=Araneus ventricosus TaxID=182803 RepID=A0A4Y2CS90_ARAVE|nr:hypothetical protein AVEN_187870-1 [Araneus ventricosus]